MNNYYGDNKNLVIKKAAKTIGDGKHWQKYFGDFKNMTKYFGDISSFLQIKYSIINVCILHYVLSKI